MKFGIRKPNIEKSIKARTTGKINRKIKKSVNPLYGKKGVGVIHNPKKSLYDKVYRKTSFSIFDIFKSNKSNVAILNLNGVSVTVNNKNQAEMYAEQIIKHCEESTNLVNNTKSPRVFFERYSFLILETENLVQLKPFIKLNGTDPSQLLINLNNSKEEETNLMINRFFEDLNSKIDNLKTENAKIKHIEKAFNELSSFDNEMTKNNINLYKNYLNKLKES